MKYTPNYSNREAYYVNKDAATAARISEKEGKRGFRARVRAWLFPMKHEPVPHDYRSESWGHSAMIVDENETRTKVKMFGFGCEIEAGDFIVKSHNEGWSSYRVDEIEYRDDPPDAFIIYATWTPGVFEVNGEGAIVRCGKK